MSNQEIVPAKQKMADLRTLLMSDKVSGQIMSALRGGIEDKKRMFRVYLTAMQTTPRILDCEPISVIGAIMQAAQVGLSLDTVFGEAFLIPRWNKNVSATVCSFQIGYKGLCKLARTSDAGVRDIYARVVYANDRFEYSYEPKTLIHTPHEDPESRGPLKYAYAKVIWKEDNYDRFVVVSAAEIKKAQDASDSFKKGWGPWVDNPDAMWAKTALRRLANTLSLNAESDLSRAMIAEDAETGGKHLLAGLDFDISMPATKPSAGNSEALDKLAGQGADPVAPGPRQQRRKRDQPAATAPATPAALEPPNPLAHTTSKLSNDDEKEQFVGNINPRTGEVIE